MGLKSTVVTKYFGLFRFVGINSMYKMFCGGGVLTTIDKNDAVELFGIKLKEVRYKGRLINSLVWVNNELDIASIPEEYNGHLVTGQTTKSVRYGYEQQEEAEIRVRARMPGVRFARADANTIPDNPWVAMDVNRFEAMADLRANANHAAEVTRAFGDAVNLDGRLDQLDNDNLATPNDRDDEVTF